MIKHNILSHGDTTETASETTEESKQGRLDQDNGSNSREYQIDQDIDIVLEPIRLTYRPNEIEKLINFFSVSDLKPETHLEA